MDLSKNKLLTSQELQNYNTARNIKTILSMLSVVIILFFFSNVMVVVSAFVLLVAAGGYFMREQMKYEQGKDLKITLQFTGLSLLTAAGFWAWFLIG